MRTVCVHFPDWTSQVAPDAVYWVDEAGQIQSYEPAPTPSTILAAMTMFSKVPSVRWGPFFKQLSERGGQSDLWETYEIGDSTTPQQFLDLLRKRY